MGYKDANSREMDEKTPHNVIDIMEEQKNLSLIHILLAYETDVYHLCSLVSAVEECLPRTQRRCFADRLAHLAEDGGVKALSLIHI